MFVVGLGTATPSYRYRQEECRGALEHSPRFADLAPRSRAILRKVLSSQNGIATRHLALPILADAFDLDPDTLHRRFLENAPVLAAQAAKKALQSASLSPGDIDALLIRTCTGYLCPGLTSYVAEILRLSPAVLCLDFVGQGCGAALPNLRTAKTLLDSRGFRRVLSICVEVCSAAFYLDDDPGVLISACLFADGAAAALLAPEPNGQRRVEYRSGLSRHSAPDRDLLKFEQKRGMLRNILAPAVPETAGRHVAEVFNTALRAARLERSDIAAWIAHPGGRDVLLAIRKQAGISERDLQYSERVLREFGNMSSPSVYFVLEAALEAGAPGGWWWMTSFGAGFSCHGALWEVE